MCLVVFSSSAPLPDKHWVSYCSKCCSCSTRVKPAQITPDDFFKVKESFQALLIASGPEGRELFLRLFDFPPYKSLPGEKSSFVEEK